VGGGGDKSQEKPKRTPAGPTVSLVLNQMRRCSETVHGLRRWRQSAWVQRATGWTRASILLTLALQPAPGLGEGWGNRGAFGWI
jgi:hypothetical protein